MHRIINEFRKEILGLPSLHTHEATTLLNTHRVPHTYCWSTSLVPKPSDWESHINVSGYFFLDLANNYTNPPKDLIDFINNKQSPCSPLIYIGFGSITGYDRSHLLQVVIEALEKTGYRALLSNLANDSDQLPSNIFKIGNVPHDWIFQYGLFIYFLK
jgi:UDP:flavonoid glycosyltransferase YjiC (YdhE family)